MTSLSTASPQTPKWSEDQARMLGEHVAQFREKLRMSAEELSKTTRDLGQQIPRSTIQKIETGGKKSVQLHEALLLSEALGIPLGYLIYGVYKPGALVHHSPGKPPKPAYWAADALTPIDPPHGDQTNTVAQAIQLIRSRAHRLSGIFTNARFLGILDSLTIQADAEDNQYALTKFATFRDLLIDSTESLDEIIRVWDPRMEERGIELWSLEEHVIPISYYRGTDPESFDPWGVKDMAKRALAKGRQEDA